MAKAPAPQSSSTQALGAAHEGLAWAYLAAQGYTLVGQNVRVQGGEIDLIAFDGDVLCFIEVRSRKSADFGHPLETIDRQKQRQVAKCAAIWMQDHPHGGPSRYDAVGIVVGDGTLPPEITLVRGAFVPTRVY